jgi:Secretion system C-terminal sorting domain
MPYYGTGNNGFYLAFGLNHFTIFAATTASGMPLPIELLHFTGKNENKDNILSWTTATEQNSSRFEVEHSTNGKNFETLGQVAATGESSDEKTYHFTHSKPAAIGHYYRLKMVDKDGTFKYSTIISLINSGSKNLTLYPNPTKNSVTIRTTDYNQPMRLFNIAGALLYSADTTPEQLDLSNFAAGMYFLHIGADVLRVVKE